MRILAKMRCYFSGRDEYGQEKVELYPVYGDSEENKTWCKATPAGQLQLIISNPEAQGKIVSGHDYIVTIEETE